MALLLLTEIPNFRFAGHTPRKTFPRFGYYSPVRNTFTIGLLLTAVMAAAAAPQLNQSELRTVQVKRPRIVIRGAYLSKVEVWAVPTGTGITPKEFMLLGNADRANPAGHNEMWVFRIPSCKTNARLLATEVFVTGFGDKGDVVGSKSLPYTGASELHEALCGKQ